MDREKTMIPKITKKGIERAISEIEQNGVPAKRKSRYYALVINGKNYPPKYVISLAVKYERGRAWSPKRFNAIEAKNYFLAHNYRIKDCRSIKEIENEIVPEDEESAFPEGKKKYAMHRSLERDVSIAKKAKAKCLKETGNLVCNVCKANFYELYGDLGYGFIEAHHKIPVSRLSENKNKIKTRILDFALVCSNCHRMLHRHRNKKLMSVEDLTSIVEKQRKKRF